MSARQDGWRSSLESLYNIPLEQVEHSPSSPFREEHEQVNAAEKYLSGSKLHLVSISFAIADLMMSVDTSILSVAQATISSEFNALDDLGWYGSTYLLAQLAFQGFFGKLYVYTEPKLLYLFSLFIFEVGSVLCAAAPLSVILILGRAIAGFGAAGMLAGSLAIFGQVVPLKERPKGLAIMVSISTISTMMGSTLGGVIVDSYLTWRFCFWVNLPIGALAMAIVVFVLDRKEPLQRKKSFREKFRNVDPFGSIYLTLSLVSLFIALQWGGTTYPWTSGQVLGCICSAVVFAGVFVVSETRLRERAMVPLHALRRRSIIVCSLVSFFIGLGQYTQFYMLPLYYQAVRGATPTMSGVYSLPFGIASIVATLIAGITMTKSGQYAPFMWGGFILYIVGNVLMYKLEPDSGLWQSLGYQIVIAFGSSAAAHASFIAVQVACTEEELPMVCSIEIFFRRLGGAIGISIGQNLFLTALTTKLAGSGIEGLVGSPQDLGISGIIAVSQSLPLNAQSILEVLLNASMMNAFILPIAAASIGAVVSFGLEWRRLE